MAKKAASIRFDEEKLELAKKETGQPSLQKVLNYFLDSVWFKHNPPKVFEVVSAKITKEEKSTTAKFILSCPVDEPNIKSELEKIANKENVQPKSLNQKKEEVPKWNTVQRVPKPPSNLSQLQKIAWIADWKSKNQ